MSNNEATEQSREAAKALTAMIHGRTLTQLVFVAAELGLADRLRDGPKSAEQLATEVEAHAPTLYRVLRAMGSVDLFAEDAEHRFALTPLSTLLRSDVANSKRRHVSFVGADWVTRSYATLLETIRTGRSSIEIAFGTGLFGFLDQNPAAGIAFHEAMSELSRALTSSLFEVYDFSSYGVIADVGGGRGALLMDILARNTSSRGILIDLPAVAEEAKREFAKAGLAERTRVVGGDFFVEVPRDADCYLLKFIIHDWDDDRAVAILTQCRQAMSNDGRVLVIERAMDEREIDPLDAMSDMLMLALTRGQERTVPEFTRLFERAGLRLTRVVPASQWRILEAVRA